MTYLHGTYAEKVKTAYSTTTSNGTIPAYIGTLPIQRINTDGASGFDYADYINEPILIKTYSDVSKLGLYSDDWGTYTLCEAIHAHFQNGSEVIAPIVLINMLDPTKVADSDTTATITLEAEGANKVGYLEDSLIALETIAIADLVKDTDFNCVYEGDSVKITITNSDFTGSTTDVTYKQIKCEPTEITATEMEKALNALDFCDIKVNCIPNVVAAPALSEIPELHTAIINKVNARIANKWYFISVSDIPSNADVNTVEKAKTWKKTNVYKNKYDKVCFPCVKLGNKIYHYSTILTYTMQRVDLENEDVPYVSPSNKVIYADTTVLADGTPFYITETEANTLNEVGITTTNIVKRGLRTWGSHMGNYNYATLGDIQIDERSDSDIRMTVYMLNFLQYNFLDNIDTPFSRKDIDAIKASIQQWLNGLVNEGKLLAGQIEFLEDSNSTDSMINGDFVFDVTHTLSPNAKSITFKAHYSTNGLSLLTGGEE